MDVLDFLSHLQKHIMATYDIETYYTLSDEDLSAINKIQIERFENRDWNYGKSPSYTYSNSVKYASGLVDYLLDVEKGYIKKASIYGDFFGEKPIELIENRLKGIEHSKASLTNCIDSIKISNYISGISNSEFVDGLTQGNNNQAKEEVIPPPKPSIEKSLNKTNVSKKPSKKNLKSVDPTLLHKPEWLRVKIKSGKKLNEVIRIIKALHLNTVCLEANCPNKMECYSRKTATFMILGKNCTRNCTFCNVTKEKPDPVDQLEPEHVAKAIKE
jgi:hypothetical protein